MERVRFITHRGVRILHVDYSGLHETHSIQRVGQRVWEAVQGEPPESVLVLVDLTGVPYTLRSVETLRAIAMRTAPFVRARAAVGLPDVARLSLAVFARATGRPVSAHPSIEAALDALAERA